MSQEPKLPALPGSSDEYWEHSSTEQTYPREGKECDHKFVHRSSLEVECVKCHAGFVLSIGWSVVEGELTPPNAS